MKRARSSSSSASSSNGFDDVGVAAGQHLGQRAGHHHVVRRRLAEPAEALHRHVQRRLARRGRAARRSAAPAACSRRPSPSALALASASRRSRFMVMPSLGAQEHQLLGLGRRLRHRGDADGLEHLARSRGIGPWGSLAVGLPAVQHLLAAAPAGDQRRRRPRPGPYRSRRGPARRRSAAGSRSRRRAPCRRARPPPGTARISARGRSPARPTTSSSISLHSRDVGGEQRQPEIGADREVGALVVDDERLEVASVTTARWTWPSSVHHVAVERVHLAR